MMLWLLFIYYIVGWAHGTRPMRFLDDSDIG